MKINKIQKAIDILKESINKKETNSIIDTNVYIDKLKSNENPNSYNDFEHKNKFDVSELILFYKEYKIPIFNLKDINRELYKKIPDLISKKKLSHKANYYLQDIKEQLNFSKLYTPTKKEIKLSKKYGFMRKVFGGLKDNRTDLLIYIVAKNNKLKIIITNNISDFIDCEDIYKNKINPNNQNELLILTPGEMINVIEEIKYELIK